MPRRFNDTTRFEISDKGWHWVAGSWLRLAGMISVGGLVSALGTLFYVSQIEPRWIEWRTLSLQIDGLPRAFEGYRLIQLSDLHLGDGKLFSPATLRRVVQRVNRLKPDAVVITGDFASHFDSTSAAGIAELAALRTRDGVFAIPGNHDYWTHITDIREVAAAAGITMLINTHHVLRRGGELLVIAGVDDVWEGQPDISATLRGVSTQTPVILLAHEPNYADLAALDSRVKLQLSGHSHGGQVRIPLAGPLVLPDMAWRYPMGLYRVKRKSRESAPMLVYTSRGLGSAEIGLRLFCRPEVTLFELHA